MPSASPAIAWIGAMAIAGLVGASLRVALRPPLATQAPVGFKTSPDAALLPLPKVPGPLPEPPATALARFWAGNPACQSATNGCQVCRRGNSDTSCSTPGIACQPAEWRCQ